MLVLDRLPAHQNQKVPVDAIRRHFHGSLFMHFWISNTCEFLLVRWQAATFHDYVMLIIAVSLTGWFLTRRRTV